MPPTPVLAPVALGSRPRVALSFAHVPPVYSRLRPPGNSWRVPRSLGTEQLGAAPRTRPHFSSAPPRYLSPDRPACPRAWRNRSRCEADRVVMLHRLGGSQDGSPHVWQGLALLYFLLCPQEIREASQLGAIIGRKFGRLARGAYLPVRLAFGLVAGEVADRPFVRLASFFWQSAAFGHLLRSEERLSTCAGTSRTTPPKRV